MLPLTETVWTQDLKVCVGEPLMVKGFPGQSVIGGAIQEEGCNWGASLTVSSLLDGRCQWGHCVEGAGLRPGLDETQRTSSPVIGFGAPGGFHSPLSSLGSLLVMGVTLNTVNPFYAFFLSGLALRFSSMGHC